MPEVKLSVRPENHQKRSGIFSHKTVEDTGGGNFYDLTQNKKFYKGSNSFGPGLQVRAQSWARTKDGLSLEILKLFLELDLVDSDDSERQ